jgi:uncharacterized protein (DUF362 family)
MQRRDFVRRAAVLFGASGVASFAGCTKEVERGVYTGPPVSQGATGAQRLGRFRPGAIETGVDVAIARNRKPAELVRAALQPLGGIESFVKQGDAVVIKPNLGFAMPPGSGATTHPEVLAEVISLVKAQKPGDVIVVDNPIDQGPVMEMNGAQEVCQAAGVAVYVAENESMFEDSPVNGALVKAHPVLKDVLDCDVYINLPVAKQHNAVDVCVGMKNQLGSILRPQEFHELGLHQCIAELARVLKPTLTIVDAVLVLTSGGPKGPGDVKEANTVLAGIDQVAVDIEGAKIVGFTVDQMNQHASGKCQIAYAADMGLGKLTGYVAKEV